MTIPGEEDYYDEDDYEEEAGDGDQTDGGQGGDPEVHGEQGDDLEDEGDAQHLGPGEQEGPEEGEEEPSDGRTGYDEEQGDEVRQDGVRGQSPSRTRRSQTRWQEREARFEQTRTQLEQANRELERVRGLQQQEEARRLQEQSRQHQEALERMTPEERNRHELNQLRGEINYQNQVNAFTRADNEDRATFATYLANNKGFGKYNAEVERALTETRKQGINLSRLVVLKYVLGEAMMKESEKSRKPINPQPQRKTPKPPRSRGDAATPQRRQRYSSERDRLYDKLKDVPL